METEIFMGTTMKTGKIRKLPLGVCRKTVSPIKPSHRTHKLKKLKELNPDLCSRQETISFFSSS